MRRVSRPRETSSTGQPPIVRRSTPRRIDRTQTAHPDSGSPNPTPIRIDGARPRLGHHRGMDLASSPHTLLLPIDPDAWAPPSRDIEVDGITFAAKTELHITLIGARLGRELYTSLGPLFLRERLTHAFAACDWQFVRSGRLLKLAQQANDGGTATADAMTRGSIIEPVDLPAMRAFHHALGRLLGRELPVPPPHVTLWTSIDPRGIGVHRASRLRALRVLELGPEQVTCPRMGQR